MIERELKYRDGDCICRGHLVMDTNEDRRPGVLVVPSGAGFGSQVISRARLLAGMGYIALAVDFFGERRVAAGLSEAKELLKPFMVDQDRLRRRIRAAFDALINVPEVDSTRVGAIGFCFGGRAVLELARSGAPVAATVAFHGLLTTDSPADAVNIKGSVLACAGADDSLVPERDLQAFQQEMRATRIDWQLHVYGGAKHAFTNPDVADENGLFAYDRVADKRSWQAMRMAFEEAFEPTRVAGPSHDPG